MSINVERVWWKPVDKGEKIWIIIALMWAIFLFVMMPWWHYYGKQNPSSETYKVSPEKFQELTNRMIEQYKVGEDAGIPVVAPPPGSDVFLLARQFQWTPVLKFKKGETYRLHLSSMDVQHGFSLQPTNMNFMVLPGYDYVLTMTPTETGTFEVVCNEFCGIGHHAMVGKIIVE